MKLPTTFQPSPTSIRAILMTLPLPGTTLNTPSIYPSKSVEDLAKTMNSGVTHSMSLQTGSRHVATQIKSSSTVSDARRAAPVH
ncbi:hypothetical protein K469DRAFT_718244 [Zopfia rhizophila CBS 207.26]|uniref:Uncharacterized protein n=1 Tax=Zopfia rhizophila CBS 207.26 TaxID=1314779 RepID=A0A6A6DFZ6_9PEZI|nr:hypothetical protein K469DRAFT_716451 [Zopfia rhizophila CBS 207.26]KAF2178424.1 hypothetical protein K469DRAFT_718244 [Zopfia rhizophila CBS 207.26]